ncbi:MAG: hypothetical protein RI580_16100, partial [Halothece sp. Uz-M2-17]|nr:hypothetical protein [Halothece sp. Uz-M2-17]
MMTSQDHSPFNSLLSNAYDSLLQGVSGEEWGTILETSFGIAANSVTAQKMETVLLGGSFLDEIELEILPSSTLEGALGAYGNGTIYLSQELLASGSETLTSVGLEEVGHAIDDYFNSTDALGDEGAIFASLIQGEDLNPETLARLQAEDDSATLTIDGQAVIVEQATLTVSNTSDNGAGSLRQAIIDANSASGADIINFDGSLSGGTITLTSGQLEITDDLTINGLGEDQLTIDADGNSRVFNIDGSGTVAVTLEGLTITGGKTTDNG